MKTKIVLFMLLAASFTWAKDLSNLPAGATDLSYKPTFKPYYTKIEYNYPKRNLIEDEIVKQMALVDALSFFMTLPPEKQKVELENQKKFLEMMKARSEMEKRN